jgi:hypothetical protein
MVKIIPIPFQQNRAYIDRVGILETQVVDIWL